MHEQHYLTPLFEPKSIAIIGASETEKSVGNFIIRNMIDAGYKGKLFAVNPKHEKFTASASYPSVEDIPQRLDLVIIATAAPTVPGIIDACGRAGVRYVVVISAGFAESELARRGARTRRRWKRRGGTASGSSGRTVSASSDRASGSTHPTHKISLCPARSA